ncbi:MAG: hypothetical protein ACLP5H_24450 [Desulfomonilaceae bacterium]
MASVLVGPGDDVEAWCTRCRMNLNHRVVAVVGNSIQKVVCLTCGSHHKFYPPKDQNPEEKEERAARGSQPDKSRKLASRAANKAYGEWTTFMKDMPSGTTPKPYKASESYGPPEYVEHPLFGTGRVLEIVGAEKIQVIFKEGRKILICNRRN